MKRLEDLNRLETEMQSKDKETIAVAPIVLIVCVLLGVTIIVVLIKTLLFPASPRVPQLVETTNEQPPTMALNEQPQTMGLDVYTDIPDDTVLMSVNEDDTSVFGGSLSRDQIRKISFLGAEASVPPSAWDVSHSKNGTIMAWTEKTGIYYNLFIASRNTTKANEDCSGLFSGYKNMIAISFGDQFDTSEVTNMNSMFKGCEQLQELDLSAFNTHNVISMDSMFSGCRRLKTLDISGFDVSSVKSMTSILDNCPDSVVVTAIPILNCSLENSRETREGVIEGTNEEPESADSLSEDDGMASDADGIKVGDTITFGSYATNDSTQTAVPVEWIVLQTDGKKALLLSKYGLSVQKYNTSYDKVTWKSCSLRKWLNGVLISAIFTPQEQQSIIETTVNNSSQQGYPDNANGGTNTQDKVFLLSYKEAFNDGLVDVDTRVCEMAPYTMDQHVYTDERSNDLVQCGWWLRSPGIHQYYAMQVTETGEEQSSRVNLDNIAVRPAMWVILSSGVMNN